MLNTPEITTPFWLQSEPTSSLPPLHFVHGNSYPTGTYRVFLNQLRTHYRIRALEIHAHNPAYPVTDNWTLLAKELIASIEANFSEPVILVGHSLGGILSLMAAKWRPDLVRCVVMLDSPLLVGWRATFLRVAKKLNLEHYFSPAKFSKRRRIIWPDREAVFQHFVNKEVFNLWPEQVLRDYVYFGTEHCDEGVTLRYRREIETAIYCTIPHNLSQFCALPFPVPIGFIWGVHSEESRQVGLAHTKKLVGENFSAIEGGHLYPFEAPEQTAEEVHLMIKKLLSS